MKLNVLYEDNHLIAVLKPGNVLTQGDFSKEKSLMDYVKEYLKEKNKKPGNVFLGLLHRLDRQVCGIILFAKTSKGASRLSAQFRSRQVKKIYHAVVLAKPKKDKGILKNYLKKENNKAMEGPDGKEAELYYELIASGKDCSLLKIEIKTGRFHQIRAQLALIGCPVLGDVKYGAPFALKDKSIALCATSVSFLTAVGGEEKTISIGIPQAWKKYYESQ